MNTNKQVAYLAIPYSFNPELSFDYANKASAYLIEQGYVVISPISQSHSIADHLPESLRKDSNFWLEQDLPLLSKCDVLVLVYLGLQRIKESKGVQAELNFAMENNIPIKILQINPNTIKDLPYEKVKEFYMQKSSLKEQYFQDAKDFFQALTVKLMNERNLYTNRFEMYPSIFKSKEESSELKDILEIISIELRMMDHKQPNWLIKSISNEFVDNSLRIRAIALIASKLLYFISANANGVESEERFYELTFEKCLEISKAKNADYTGASDNPFENFMQVEKMSICTTEIGFLTRMTDKYMRIKSFIEKGELQVKDESVEDTLLDLINYCSLLNGYALYKERIAE